MEKIKCNGCHYEHCCPMAGAGFGYFTMDVCPYIKDEHSKASNPAKVVFTKNDLQCLIEAIINDCNVGKEDIEEVLEGVLKSVREKNSETDSKRELEQCCLKVFDKEEDFVDLGLPSGTLWAKCNLGAEKETDFGYFYQWGDTHGYSDVDENQFKRNDYKWDNSGNITKYNETDNKLVLDNEDDPVFAATNGKFKSPTQEQLQELINHTDHEWIENFEESGVNGMMFINKNDDTKYIFIPAAGDCYAGSHHGVGSWGYVWSASRYMSNAYGAWYMYFYADDVYVYHFTRCLGYSVRGVLNK